MFFCFFIHDGLRRHLYLSIAKKALEKKIGIRIYCFSLEEYYWFKKQGLSYKNIKLVKMYRANKIIDTLENTIDVVANFLTIQNASTIYHSTLMTLCELDAIQEDVIVFGGNGLHAFDKAIITYKSKRKNIYTLFTELSNIEGKVFFDSMGSNASSYFYKMLCSSKYEYPDYDASSFDNWKKKYILEKLNKHIIPQAPKKNNLKLICHRLFGLTEIFLRTPSYQRFKIEELFAKRKRLEKKLYAAEWNEFNDDITHISNYILFPLQVFGDSQIKLHSTIDVEEALLIAIEKAHEMSSTLIVKPHPAEPYWSSFEKIILLKKEHDFLISTKNTFELIINAKKVIVINSTVGLETLICNIDVEFLGDSFYKFFIDNKIFNYYINHWLIDIDIFKENIIDDLTFSKIIDIAKLNLYA